MPRVYPLKRRLDEQRRGHFDQLDPLALTHLSPSMSSRAREHPAFGPVAADLRLAPNPRRADPARAMSRENVEALQRGLEAGNRGDVETVLEELDPEVEWHSVLHALLGGEQTVFRGHDGVREMFRDAHEAFGKIRIEISEIRDLGDGLVAIGRYRASGAKTLTPFALVTEIKNGKTTSVRGAPWTASTSDTARLDTARVSIAETLIGARERSTAEDRAGPP